MGPLSIATHLSEAELAPFAAAVSDIRFTHIAPATAVVPDDVDAILAMPFGKAGAAMPADPPPGWPFGLKWIQLLTVGLDYYPAWFLEGPQVTANQSLSGTALAEFAMACMLAAEKQMPDIWIREAADWRPRFIGDLAGKTLGIFGFGSFGAALAQRALAFGMTVVAARQSDAPLPAGVERARDISELVRRSDHLVLAAPASASTRHILNGETLGLAKAGMHLINLARGSLVDEAALLAALDAGRVARATLDVMASEPPKPGNRLLAHPRVFVSPHNSTLTPGTMAALVGLFADNAHRLANGESLRCVVAQKGAMVSC